MSNIFRALDRRMPRAGFEISQRADVTTARARAATRSIYTSTRRRSDPLLKNPKRRQPPSRVLFISGPRAAA